MLRFTEYQFNHCYPQQQYAAIWRYNNRVVLRESGTTKPVFFFFCKNGYYYEFIIKTRDFDLGREISENVWDPKATPVEASGKNFLLDHIQSMLQSIVKKGNTESLRKFDFCSVYYAKGVWHAFYPTVEDLIDFHVANVQEQDEDYLNYLRSDELKAKREEWDKEPFVDMPQQKK